MACPPRSLVSSGTSKSSGSGCAALTSRSCQASSCEDARALQRLGFGRGRRGKAEVPPPSAPPGCSAGSSTTARAAPSKNPPKNSISPSKTGSSSTRRLRRCPVCRYCVDLISADAVFFKYAAIHNPPWYHGSCTLHTASYKLPANLHQTCIIFLRTAMVQNFKGKNKLFPVPPRLL